MKACSPTALLPIFGISLAGLTTVAPCRATEPSPFHLDFEAASGCPSQQEFDEAVSTRGGHFARFVAETDRNSVVVRLSSSPEGYAGSLLVQLNGNVSQRREVEGRDCSEVAEALAVVAAIALGGQHEALVEKDEKPSEEPPQRNLVSAEQNEERPTAYRGQFRAGRNSTMKVQAGTLRIDVDSSLSAWGGVTVGLIPSVVLPRTGLSLRHALFLTAPGGAQRLLALARVRLGAFLPTNDHRFGDVDTNIAGGVSYGLGLCASPIYNSRGFSFLICGEYGGGSLGLDTTERTASGTPVFDETNLGFGSVALGVEAEYTLTDWLHFYGSLDGESFFGVTAPSQANGLSQSDIESWSFRGTLGLGFHF